MKKKGQVISIQSLPQLVLILALAVLITAAAAIALNSFKTSSSVTANSYAYNITAAGEAGLDNLSDQYSTIGTIIGVAILITIVVGAFGYLAFRGSRGI